MMEHFLKCWSEYYQAVKSGAKPFEIRKWDRPYKVGDTLVLQEYDPNTGNYTRDYIRREVTYLLDMTYLPGDNTPHFIGYVVMGLQDAALRAELDAVKRERDAAIADLKALSHHAGNCDYCKFCRNDHCTDMPVPWVSCRDVDRWQWRGAQEATNADQTAQD